MSHWFEEDWQNSVRFSLRTEGTVARARSEFQLIEIFDTPAFGRVLALDSVLMTSERDEFFYHEMIVHPTLTAVADPHRVLIIGGGDGGTAREVLRHDAVQSVTMVEIDRMVIELCQNHLRTIGSAWDDPRLKINVGDGIAYVRDAPDNAFDVVILDGSDPIGPAAPLFDERFYADVARVLRPGGAFSLQSESPMLTTDIWVSTQQRLRRVFSEVHPCFGPAPLYSTGVWSWSIASFDIDPRAPNPARLTPALASCRYYTPDTHPAAFVMPPYVRQLLDDA